MWHTKKLNFYVCVFLIFRQFSDAQPLPTRQSTRTATSGMWTRSWSKASSGSTSRSLTWLGIITTSKSCAGSRMSLAQPPGSGPSKLNVSLPLYQDQTMLADILFWDSMLTLDNMHCHLLSFVRIIKIFVNKQSPVYLSPFLEARNNKYSARWQ